MSHTGQLLKEIRTNVGMSQLQLANKLKYSSPQFVSNVERGITLIPVKAMKAYSKNLGVPVLLFVHAHLKDVEAKILKVVGN